MLIYFRNILYKKGESYYINEDVDKIFGFLDWIKKCSDEDIMTLCDNDKEVTAREIRETVKNLIITWVSNNCKGDLL